VINVQGLDRDGSFLVDELELLKHEAENVRTFYSLTGPARKEYVVQVAEAEAERIRIVRQAQAEGILAIRRAEAEGFKLIGEALARVQNPELVMQLASLSALQEVAESIANGKATKLFLPQRMGEIFSLVGGTQEVLGGPPASQESVSRISERR
jgi:regulator of protease activity HflC (stomatin/prohibitin superfamily)